MRKVSNDRQYGLDNARGGTAAAIITYAIGAVVYGRDRRPMPRQIPS